MHMALSVDSATTDPIINADYGVHSDQAAFVRGMPVMTLLGKLVFMPLAVKSP